MSRLASMEAMRALPSMNTDELLRTLGRMDGSGDVDEEDEEFEKEHTQDVESLMALLDSAARRNESSDDDEDEDEEGDEDGDEERAEASEEDPAEQSPPVHSGGGSVRPHSQLNPSRVAKERTGRSRSNTADADKKVKISPADKPPMHTIRRQHKRGETLQVAHYQLAEQLGSGAFGVVLKGLDVRTGQFVAVKRLQCSPKDQHTIMNEVSLLQRLQHPNIVKYIETVQSHSHLNIVLEYVDSGSLQRILRDYGYFPEALAAIYTAQILHGLAYLHSQDVVHRDIKAGNLLINREGTVKLADFGIATTVQTSSKRHSLVEGSPYWMAPEVIELQDPTTAADIWSLGCTLIELLTGAPPYFEMTPVAAIYRMAKETPPFPDDASPELLDFLSLCFQRDACKRPSAAALSEHAWLKKHAPAANKKIQTADVKKTIKRYTTLRDAATVKQQLAQMAEWEKAKGQSGDLSSSMDVAESSSSSEGALRDSSGWKSASSGGAGMKGAIGEARKKKSSGEKKKEKKKRKKRSRKRKKRINIVRTETRRSIFSYTVYVVDVRWGEQKWTIEHTESNFRELHGKLSKIFTQLTLPPFPPKKFWNVTDPEFVQRRRQELQHYCNEILEIKPVASSDALQYFLHNGLE